MIIWHSQSNALSGEDTIGLYNNLLTTPNPNPVIALLQEVNIDIVTAMYYVEKGLKQIDLEQFPEIDIQILRALCSINCARNFFNVALENY